MGVEEPILLKLVSSSKSDQICSKEITSNSFRNSLDQITDQRNEAEERLSWLESQIIGKNVEFDSPFGKRRLTYADHTASGQSLHYVENFILSNVLPFYGNTHTCDSYVGQQTTKTLHEAIKYIKKCLGGGEDDAILFCGSGTTAAIKRLQEVMGIAVASTMRDRVLKCLTDEERWVVFVGPHEHHSNLLSWRQSLAEVIEIGVDDNGLVDIEALRKQLESFKHANRPILGSFSACSNVTGIYSDTRAISRLLHQYDGLACFDFAASGPYAEIDMRSGENDGYDAIFLSPHKFIGGPGSPGILLMNKAVYQLKCSAPSTCGGGTVDYVNGFNEKDTLYMVDIEERENAGTPQIIQTIRAALAFWVKDYIGYQVIEKQENLYIKNALERLVPNKNIWVLGNTNAKRQAILSFLIHSTTNYAPLHSEKEAAVYNMWGENNRGKPLHGPFVSALLNDLFGIQARGGCSCAGPYGHFLLGIDQAASLAIRSAITKGYVGVKPGWTRVSFPYYMPKEEFDFILDAVEFIAIYGQRFLPLYEFHWESARWSLKKKALDEVIGKQNRVKIIHKQGAIICEEKKEHKNSGSEDGKDNEIVNKYASYLETAKHIANLLPKFPAQRRIPTDSDIDILHFRV